MSNEKNATELGRLSLIGTRKNETYDLELALHELAFDEEVQAWRCEAFIYGYKGNTFKMVGYGACTLQALSMAFFLIRRKFCEFIKSEIHIQIYDL